MGFVFALALFWLVFVRWGRWTRYACTSALYGGSHRCHAGMRGWSRHDLSGGAMRGGPARRERMREEGVLEVLQRRYVAGELSDEQYEEELDALFRAKPVRGQA